MICHHLGCQKWARAGAGERCQMTHERMAGSVSADEPHRCCGRHYPPYAPSR